MDGNVSVHPGVLHFTWKCVLCTLSRFSGQEATSSRSALKMLAGLLPSFVGCVCVRWVCARAHVHACVCERGRERETFVFVSSQGKCFSLV